MIYRYLRGPVCAADAMAERATNRLMERLMPVLYADVFRQRVRASVDAFMCFLDDSPNVHCCSGTGCPARATRSWTPAGTSSPVRWRACSATTRVVRHPRARARPGVGAVLVGAVQTTAEWRLVHRDLTATSSPSTWSG
ncbi:hypothetical protein HBB16_09245 [Pseudonocardia sp. MCCB 268]|nr:hypothetical protein [Pseudonocardia cytotoxica]